MPNINPPTVMGMMEAGYIPGFDKWKAAKIREDVIRPAKRERVRRAISSSKMPLKIHSSNIGRTVTVMNRSGREISASLVKIYSSWE